MELQALTDNDRIQHFDRVFIELVGGDSVWQMMVDHHAGHSYRTIGEMNGVSHMTARRWITVGKAAMRRAGMPCVPEPHEQPAVEV